ncbi:MAG: pyridoxal-phosphate dependent enzyme [Pedobacter sp.]|nr:pyridoxal-phosphate dependent enzyme [Pedobacter sp.]MDQ8053802.1 pyridoxal-phosphate dependent enzyme [Pedobacter sp.]
MEVFSPIQQVTLPTQHQIWVKRDDLIDPYISGNKWRKLKYILATAIQTKRTHLVTFGGAYSNHLVATAAAAARHHLTATAFVRGEEVENEMLLLCRLFGMELRFVDRDCYRDKRSLFSKHFGDHGSAYFIDEGGASEQAVEGCREIITELPMHFDHIFCAAGTGTTAAGLLREINAQKLQSKLHVIPVLKGAAFIEKEIAAYEKNIDQLVLHLDYHFGGYAKTNPELISYIKGFTAATGILIDPVYTAKMCYAIKDLFEKGLLKKEEKVLAIHTGGLLGLLGMREKFAGGKA